MPIKPENREHYPKHWRAISDRIRFERAQGRCECTGECSLHVGRCERAHGALISMYGATANVDAKVVLTVAHRVHGPDCSDDNLFAACQRCHLNYDAKMHASHARATAARKAGQKDLF